MRAGSGPYKAHGDLQSLSMLRLRPRACWSHAFTSGEELVPVIQLPLGFVGSGLSVGESSCPWHGGSWLRIITWKPFLSHP